MLAEWNVEIGPDAPVLEIPWQSDDGQIRFFDLKNHPELLIALPEARASGELREFLQWLNSPESPWETTKCDLWSSEEINAEEEILGATWKFGSYVDLISADLDKMANFSGHERWIQSLAMELRTSSEPAAAAELNLRRCFDRRHGAEREGFYITFVLHGYGDDEAQARERWGNALRVVQQAMSRVLWE